MATSIGQYAPVSSPGKPPSLTEKPGRPQSTGLQSRTRPKRPCTHRCKASFACGSSAPERVEYEAGAAAWLVGTLMEAVCRGSDCFHYRSYSPIRAFFRASYSWRSEGLFGQCFSLSLPMQALRGLPCLGSFSVVWHIRHIEASPHSGWGPTL